MDSAAVVSQPAGAPPVVRVVGFRKRYGRHEAVKGIDLDVGRGEIFGLIGPDGAGKSTLLKSVAGVLSFEGGRVEVFGIPITSERSAERIKDRIGFLPQGLGLSLYPELSIDENVDYFGRLRLVPEGELARRKDRLLSLTRLGRFRDRPMKQLSGGMKQKLGLVCSLIHEPPLVILDEPTTGVDPVSRRDFWAILAELLRDRGTTVLVSTAYMDEASRFHRLALLHEGRVLVRGEPDEILAQVPGRLVEVRAEPQLEAVARLRRRFPQVEALGARVNVFVDRLDTAAAEREVREALGDLAPREIRASEPTLEDALLAMIRVDGPAEESGLPPSPPGDAAGDRGSVAILADGLSRRFGGFLAVDDVSFRVAQGEIFGLLGANGAGKTTVIKMLTGIVPPTGGAGRVAGADMRSAGRAIKERIGYMSQAFSLYQDLTVVENIRLYAGIYGLGRAEGRRRTEWIVAMAGLVGQESDRAGSLPMGVRQRLALGCALVHRPRVLFLDEPTSGVDPVGRRRFWEILFRMTRDEGVAILITTHYMSEAEHCDHLVLMYAGRVVADASPEVMKRQVEQDEGRVLEVHADRPLDALEALKRAGFAGAALHGKAVHLLAPDVDDATRRIREALDAAGARTLGIAGRPLSMEDVFVSRVLALEQEGAP